MYKIIIPLLFATAILSSCSKGPTTAIVLSTAYVLDTAYHTGNRIGIITAGDTVEYLDERPKQLIGSQRHFLKIRVDSLVGWVDPINICVDCRPAMIKNETTPYVSATSSEGPPVSVRTYANFFVAADSVEGDRTHIYSEYLQFHAWVATSDLSEDPADVTVAGLIHRLDGVLVDDPGRFKAFGAIAKKYSSHPLITTCKVNLNGLSDGDLLELQKSSSDGPVVFDKADNTAIFGSKWFDALFSFTLLDILMPAQGDDPDGYSLDDGTYVSTNPRMRYFTKYIDALPPFIKLPVKSEASGSGEDKASAFRAFMLYRLDRSPENIQNLYGRFKGTIKELIEGGLVNDVRPDVNNLIKAYDHIVTLQNYKATMKNVSIRIAAWDKAHKNKKGIIEGYYILNDQEEVYRPIMTDDVYADGKPNTTIWYFSFWTRRFAEGNEQVVYDILKEIVQIVPGTPEGSEEGDGGEVYGEGVGDGDNPEADSDPPPFQTLACTYEGFESHDCSHITFSCDDYGNADTSELTGDDLALWKSLIVDTPNGSAANPDLVGKEFVITVGVGTGTLCTERNGADYSGYPEGDVPKIIAFSRSQN